VHDTRRMGHGHGIQHIHHQHYGLARSHGTALLEDLVQRTAGYVLKHQIGLLVLDVGFVHRDDIGMLDPPDTARLVQPVGHGLGVGAAVRAHDLDRDFPLQTRVKRQPDGGLGTLAEDLAQFKAPQRVCNAQCAGRQHGSGAGKGRNIGHARASEGSRKGSALSAKYDTGMTAVLPNPAP